MRRNKKETKKDIIADIIEVHNCSYKEAIELLEMANHHILPKISKKGHIAKTAYTHKEQP